MQGLFRKYKTYLIGIVLGGLAGYLYWRFVGCSSGTCPITSRWYNSTLFGIIFGILLAVPSKKKEVGTSENDNGNS